MPADHGRPRSTSRTPQIVRRAGTVRVDVDSSSAAADTEFSMTVPMTRSPVTLRLAVGPQNTLTVTVSLPGATEAEPP